MTVGCIECDLFYSEVTFDLDHHDGVNSVLDARK